MTENVIPYEKMPARKCPNEGCNIWFDSFISYDQHQIYCRFGK